MSSAAISIQGISKRYRLGAISRRTLSDELKHAWLKLRGQDSAEHIGKVHRTSQRTNEIFWALQDITFDIPHGAILGLIGGNGAGKSTLLKILSRITEPTSGQAVIHGRVGSLLEVGTGFHPELTGRENVYMNGTLLGMRKREVAAKFDEIVAFSGVEKFIDTPVKRYSSGMYVRLAFAVAAHLEPEILIVDEVLAVGDAAFQRKCLGKMGEVARSGRTVVFVSHNMAAMQNLCDSCVVLKKGQIAFGPGPVEDGVADYLTRSRESISEALSNRKDRMGHGNIRVTNIEFLNGEGRPVGHFNCGETATFRIHYRIQNPHSSYQCGFSLGIDTDSGTRLTTFDSRDILGPITRLQPEGFVDCRLESLPLGPGMYRLGFTLFEGQVIEDAILSAATFQVESGDFFKTGHFPNTHTPCLLTPNQWHLHS